MATPSSDKRKQAFETLEYIWKETKLSTIEGGFLLGSSLILNPLDRLRTIKQAKGVLSYYEIQVQSSSLGNLKSRLAVMRHHKYRRTEGTI
jgi:hypothetical protein